MSCGGGRNALSSRGWYREEDVGRDAIGKGTHRLRDEEREDAGDGGAAGHAAVDESARREETRGGVGCQPGCASTSRVATVRGSAGKIKWDRARHVLGGRGGADGDVALGHGLSRDLGDDGGTGEEGGHGVGVGWRVWVCAERMDGSAEQKSTTWLFLLFEIAKSDVAARTRRVAFGANFRRNAFSLWTPWMGALFSCAHKETFSFRLRLRLSSSSHTRRHTFITRSTTKH